MTRQRAFGVLAALGLLLGIAAPAQAAVATQGRTSLIVSVDLGVGQIERWTLTCDPTGGTHPNRARACALLAADGAQLMSNRPTGLMCSMVYGGPERATVSGLLDGQRVRKQFARTDGCQTALWRQARALFTVPGTVVVRGAISPGPTCPGPQFAGQDCTDESVAGGIRFTSTGEDAVRASAFAGRGFAVRLAPGSWTATVTSVVGMSCAPVRFRAPAALPVTIPCDTGMRQRG